MTYYLARAPRTRSWLFGRRETGCLLLGGGFRLVELTCCCCGRDFEVPRRRGEKFSVALPILEPKALSPRLAQGARLFVGSRVLVAMVNHRLDETMDRSVAFIGEKVLVVLAKLPQGVRVPYVFCRGCGANVLKKARGVGEPYYKWDWLADLRPRWLGAWSARRRA